MPYPCQAPPPLTKKMNEKNYKKTKGNLVKAGAMFRLCDDAEV